MKLLNNPVGFATGDENCFNIAYDVASRNPELRLQAGIFLLFDYNSKYWDSIYLNHYWCITPDVSIVDGTKGLWEKFAAKVDFKIQLSPEYGSKIILLGDPSMQIKLINILQSEQQEVVGPTRHPEFFGGAEVIYMPGVFFKPEAIPAFIIETMKFPGFFTVEDVDKAAQEQYGKD
jgi:hypothetical protein